MPNDENKTEKLKKLAKMLSESKGANKEMPMSAEEWEEFLMHADEDVLNDGLAIMNEEKQMRADSEKKALKKHQVNKTRFLQREEQIKVEAKQIINKNNNGS